MVARKPLSESSVARNVLEYGTGALNIDESRVGGSVDEMRGRSGVASESNRIYGQGVRNPTDDVWQPSNAGRWPANVVLSHSPECNGECVEGCPVEHLGEPARFFKTFDGEPGFKYCAKSSRAERNKGLEGELPRVRLRSDLTPEQREHVYRELEAAGVEL